MIDILPHNGTKQCNPLPTTHHTGNGDITPTAICCPFYGQPIPKKKDIIPLYQLKKENHSSIGGSSCN